MPARRRLLVLAGGGLALALGAAAAAPALLRGPLQDALIAEVEARLDATVTVGEARVSLLADFPDASLSLSEVRVEGRGPFAGVALLDARELEVAVDLGSLRQGPLRITAVRVTDTTVHLVTDAEGRANTDLPDDGAEAEAGPLPELWLQDVSIDGLTVRVEDARSDQQIALEGVHLTGESRAAADAVDLKLSARADRLDVRQDGVRWLADARVETTLDLTHAPASGATTLRDSRVAVNALAVALSGAVTPTDAGTELDLRFAGDQTTLASLLSLVPEAYSSDFDQVQADGAVTLSGTVAGLLPDEGDDLPAFELAVSVAEGRFRYPSLPVGVHGIALEATASHPGGPPDAVVVRVPAFALAVDGSPFRGAVTLTRPISDPHLDLTLDGRLDLGKLRDALPGEPLGVTGLLAVDLRLVGAVSDFEAVDTDAVTAEGTLTLAGGVYEDDAWPLPFQIERLEVGLDPRRLDLAGLDLRFGGSDVQLSGEVDNILAWALQDAVLTGRFTLRSSMLDGRPFEGDPDAPPSDESSIVAVPPGYDLDVALDLDRVQTHDYDLRAVRGAVRVKGDTVRLRKVGARTWGGRVTLDGTYRAPTEAWADVDLDIRADDLSVSETVTSVATVERMAPVLKGAGGRVGTHFTLKSRLQPDLAPEPMTLAAAGLLTAHKVALDTNLLEAVSTFTGNAAMGKLALDSRPFRFEVESGTVRLPEVPIEAGPARGRLSGRTGVVDQKLDLKLDLAVPTQHIRGGEAARLLQQSARTVGLAADIGGTWSAPKVRVRLSDATRDAVVDAVDEQVDAAVDEALAAARAQGDRLLAEAERQADKLRGAAALAADKLREEAREQAKRLRKKAAGNPLQEVAAKEAGKELIRQADKQAKKLEKEADDQADRLLREARQQADRLLEEAERKARR